jgi:hypothetical protein
VVRLAQPCGTTNEKQNNKFYLIWKNDSLSYRLSPSIVFIVNFI